MKWWWWWRRWRRWRWRWRRAIQHAPACIYSAHPTAPPSNTEHLCAVDRDYRRNCGKSRDGAHPHPHPRIRTTRSGSSTAAHATAHTAHALVYTCTCIRAYMGTWVHGHGDARILSTHGCTHLVYRPRAVGCDLLCGARASTRCGSNSRPAVRCGTVRHGARCTVRCGGVACVTELTGELSHADVRPTYFGSCWSRRWRRTQQIRGEGPSGRRVLCMSTTRGTRFDELVRW